MNNKLFKLSMSDIIDVQDRKLLTHHEVVDLLNEQHCKIYELRVDNEKLKFANKVLFEDMRRQPLITICPEVKELEHEVTLLTKFILSKGFTLDDFNEWLVKNEFKVGNSNVEED